MLDGDRVSKGFCCLATSFRCSARCLSPSNSCLRAKELLRLETVQDEFGTLCEIEYARVAGSASAAKETLRAWPDGKDMLSGNAHVEYERSMTTCLCLEPTSKVILVTYRSRQMVSAISRGPLSSAKL